jgi:phosphate:Na+ symporter
MVAFSLTKYALPAIGLGFTLSFFGRRKVVKLVGEILLGVGLLFLGLKIMSDFLGPIAKLPKVHDMITAFAATPILGVLAGAVLTGIVQSSSATTGLFIALGAEGALTLEAAVPLVLGANIGTCVTALLASIGTSVMARRSAVVHLMFNVCGVTLMFLLLNPFIAVVSGLGANLPRQIANAHTLFNVTVTLIMIPLAGQLVRLATWIVKGSDKESFDPGPRFIDKHFLETPTIALIQTQKEAHRMAEFVQGSLRMVFEGILANDATVDSKMASSERMINDLDRAITDYLTQLARRELGGDESQRLSGLLLAVADIERIADHAESLARLAAEKAEAAVVFSPEATNEIRAMFQIADSAVSRTVATLSQETQSRAAAIVPDDELSGMERRLRQAHIGRLTDGTCTPPAGILFLDVASHLTRIGDHAANAARLVTEQE